MVVNISVQNNSLSFQFAFVPTYEHSLVLVPNEEGDFIYQENGLVLDSSNINSRRGHCEMKTLHAKL